jgi:hypothetical protein
MRLFNIIISEINSDKLKLEEELERLLNNKEIETNDKVNKIKAILREIAITEMSFKTFGNLMPIDEDMTEVSEAVDLEEENNTYEEKNKE